MDFLYRMDLDTEFRPWETWAWKNLGLEKPRLWKSRLGKTWTLKHKHPDKYGIWEINMTLESYISKYHAQYHLLLKLFKSQYANVYLFISGYKTFIY